MKQAVPGSPMVIIFEDNGEGVADEEKELIFRNGFGRNTGLGLALSRDILSVTGMSIRETGTKGMGARFEIQVPARSWRGDSPLDPERGDQR
jgi:signal transduction histidine kinase